MPSLHAFNVAAGRLVCNITPGARDAASSIWRIPAFKVLPIVCQNDFTKSRQKHFLFLSQTLFTLKDSTGIS
ncbi:hypothetical protein WJX75_004958 [Coccomyxa subellipsoidea]|uniref:Uncharacterized protein n=1 Tax=Coccomyxa subellipsoidea TaxID=248742 RepID=A0ABR2Z427_9CHLO